MFLLIISLSSLPSCLQIQNWYHKNFPVWLVVKVLECCRTRWWDVLGKEGSHFQIWILDGLLVSRSINYTCNGDIPIYGKIRSFIQMLKEYGCNMNLLNRLHKFQSYRVMLGYFIAVFFLGQWILRSFLHSGHMSSAPFLLPPFPPSTSAIGTEGTYLKGHWGETETSQSVAVSTTRLFSGQRNLPPL